MSNQQQANVQSSPFIPHAIALGKAFQEYTRRQNEITRADLERLLAEAAEQIESIYALDPKEPVDALVLLSCIKQFAAALRPENQLPEEFIESYLAHIVAAANRLEQYINTATGVTLAGHGVNLTDEPWH